MKAFYIKITDKPHIIKRLLNIIEIKNNELIIQPVKQKNTQKYINRTIKKIKKICTKKEVNNIVLSKQLQEELEFINAIKISNLHIFDGRWLFPYMIYETMEYIMQQTKQKKEETEIAILTKDATNQAMESVKMFAKGYKAVGIVTQNINKFKYLERKIFSEYGTAITVTNNRRKSLEKVKIIINFDFSRELINQYNIYENAIIINMLGNVQIKKKRFNGLTVNNFEVTSPRINDYFEMQKLNSFYARDLLEAHLCRRDSFANIRQDLINSHFVVKELYGLNGKLL